MEESLMNVHAQPLPPASPARHLSPKSKKRLDIDDPREVLAWQVYDWADSVYAVASQLFLPTFFVGLATEAEWESPTSLWYNLNVGTTLIQLVCFLTFCSIADYGNLKKKLLVTFAVLGSITCCLVSATDAHLILVACACYVVSKVSSNIASLFYDAYLNDISTPLQRHKVSARGAALGYFGMLVYLAFVALGLLVGGVTHHSESQWTHHRIPILFAGAWWLGFSLLTFRHLRPRQGLPVPAEAKGRLLRWSFQEGTRRQWRGIKRVKTMPDLFRFTIAFVFLSEGLNTAATGGVLYLKNELGFPVEILAIAAVVAYCSSAIGLVMFEFVSRRMQRKEFILYINIGMMVGLCIYTLWLSTTAELMAFAVVVGCAMGSVGAFTRSLLSNMIPKGEETEFFSIFKFTQRGTSWIGSVIIGTGSRYLGEGHVREMYVFTVVGLFGIGCIIVKGVNSVRGSALATKIDQDKESVVWNVEDPVGQQSDGQTGHLSIEMVPVGVEVVPGGDGDSRPALAL